LTRACGQRGNPAFGSAGFTQALNDAEFFPSFARAVSEWQERLLSHPRASPVFRLRASSEELANRAVRMFREQYKPAADVFSQDAAREVESPAEVSKLLRRKGALSEVRLTHPALPFLGVLDRVQLINDGVEVVDFKTGRPSDSHRKQLFRYALLWWRATSEAPVRITAQYLNGAESWTVARQALEEVEVELAKALPQLSAALGLRSSVAKPSTACPSCAVRAHCSSGWHIVEEASLADGRGDVELVMTARTGSHGFMARSRKGLDVAVVYEAPVASLLPEYSEGQTLRILGGVWREKRTQLEIKAWTEVFVLPRGGA
jgi:hypothetical protein